MDSFGSLVFGDSEQQKRIPKSHYQGLRRTIINGEPLDQSVADAVAKAVKEWAVEQGATMARGLGRLPKMADWAEERRGDGELLSEWQVYRLLDVPRGAWTAFQFLVRERLREEGVEVRADGTLGKKR